MVIPKIGDDEQRVVAHYAKSSGKEEIFKGIYLLEHKHWFPAF